MPLIATTPPNAAGLKPCQVRCADSVGDQDDHAVDRHRRGVGDEQDREVDAGEQAADDRGEREADVDDPVEQAVGLDALRRRHHVGHDRHDRGAVELADEADHADHGGDRAQIAQLAEHREGDRAAEQRDDERDLATEPVGQVAAGERRGHPAAAEHGHDPAGVGDAEVADADQVDGEQRDDEPAEPVDQGSPPDVPVRARRHGGNAGDPLPDTLEHRGSVGHRGAVDSALPRQKPVGGRLAAGGRGAARC
jgi:hypothetical protein